VHLLEPVGHRAASLGAAGAPIAAGIRDQVDGYAAPAAAAAVQVGPGALPDADVWGAVQLGRSKALQPLAALSRP
jgi:hypothetical protein